MNDAPRASGSDQPYRGPDIERLLSLLQDAPAGAYALDKAIWRYLLPNASHRDDVPPPYTVSLDAARSLCVSGTLWAVGSMEDGPFARLVWPQKDGGYIGGYFEATAATAPLALCIAALRANVAKPKSVPSLLINARSWRVIPRILSPREQQPERDTMTKVTESIYGSASLVVPLADVQHMEKNKHGGLVVVTKHTRWDNDTGTWANNLFVPETEREAFLAAWCRYRSELEADTLADLRPDAARDFPAEMQAIWNKASPPLSAEER